MSPIYVPGKVVLAQTYVGIDDPDAAVYIANVEAADEAESPGVGALETATKVAIHSFVKGCKNDGIWPAIKASCILAGARTLTGALVPLVGAAPTNVGGLFVAGDYNRKTGLVGDRSTKYLNSNRANNADPQNSQHISVFATAGPSDGVFGRFAGEGTGSTGRSVLGHGAVSGGVSQVETRSRCNTSTTTTGAIVYPCLIAISRSVSSEYKTRRNQATSNINVASDGVTTDSIEVFRGAATTNTDARLAFYSIGESLDLALLDARVTDLINAIGAAIP